MKCICGYRWCEFMNWCSNAQDSDTAGAHRTRREGESDISCYVALLEASQGTDTLAPNVILTSSIQWPRSFAATNLGRAWAA